MQLAALLRWHWIVIAVVVGLTIGLVRSSADSGEIYGVNVHGYGIILPDQQQFENGLIQDYNGTRLFSDPVVYPHWTTEASGKSTLVYIVSGRYWDGHPQEKNGKMVAEWLPRSFIAATPYKPKIGLADSSGKTVAEFPTVIDFLAALRARYGVTAHYAWWAACPVWTSLITCVILIGGVWPTVINLLTWGTFSRPPEAKAISLWNVRTPKPTTPAHKPTIQYTGDDDLEEQLLSTAPVNGDAQEPPAAPVRPLAAGPLEAVAETPQDEREFGAKEDDYYPTERRHHSKPQT